MTQQDKMEKETIEQKEAMMKQEAMEKNDTMMKKDDSMMDSDKMMKDDSAMMKKDDAMVQDDAMMKKDTMVVAGSYTTYSASAVTAALAAKKNVVLFFHATWCPTCKAADTSFKKETPPANTVVFKVDYDTNKDLRSKY